ncbi:MAG TPA: hypothetical protein VG165_15240 [Solirubrobacteraceae bacterium]|jgi:hypothetical protein|nr:hypothetical protein [Solirubrobacteraceae bacterium]
MPGMLAIDTFLPRLGEVFRVRLDDGATLDLRLDRATAHGEPYVAGGRAPFAIEFTGPPQTILPQRIYRLEHDELEALEIFLVPLAPDASGARYEAVFN